MLFRDENPVLGRFTKEGELSGHGTGQPTLNYYKPTTRQIVELTFDGVRNTSAQITGWLFKAPWQCQIVSASVIMEVAQTTANTVQVYTVPYASQPEAPSSGNAVFAAAQSLSSATATSNTVITIPLETTASSYLTLNPGDLLGYAFLSAATSVIGGLLQVEIVQVG